jgi:hypothetical protein
MNRRHFLALGAASAATLHFPAQAAPLAQGVVSDPILARLWGWGHHVPEPDGEYIQGPFDTHADALADAQGLYDVGEAFQVSRCTSQILDDADYDEVLLDWLCNTRRDSLEIMLFDALSNANEGKQFEDEVDTAVSALPLWRAEWDLMEYLVTFIERTGLFFDVGNEFTEDGSAIILALQNNLFFKGDVNGIVCKHIPVSFYASSNLLDMHETSDHVGVGG